MEGNVHKVPKKLWSRWSEHARRVFNDVYEIVEGDQVVMVPNGCPVIRPEHWEILAWNVAVVAANVADG